MFRPAIIGIAVGFSMCMSASTLQRLSLNDMILKSTTIVRGKVQPGPSAVLRGALIYTHYQLLVTSTYKGTAAAPTIDVAIPGGQLNGLLQPVAGAPRIAAGQDCVMFLWTSKTGLTQIIGLSQGLFNVTTNAQGQVMVARGAANATILDSSGNVVPDSSMQMPLAQLVNTIQSVLAGTSGSGSNGQ
jgi:hypothetical protein